MSYPQINAALLPSSSSESAFLESADPTSKSVERASLHYETDISRFRASLDSLYALHESYSGLRSTLQTLPSKLSHPVMVPFGSKAFAMGQLVHTNEVTVLLGDNYYAKVTAPDAAAIAGRRIAKVESDIAAAQKGIDRLSQQLSRARDWFGASGSVSELSAAEDSPPSASVSVDADGVRAEVRKAGVNEDGEDIFEITEFLPDEEGPSPGVKPASSHDSDDDDDDDAVPVAISRRPAAPAPAPATPGAAAARVDLRRAGTNEDGEPIIEITEYLDEEPAPPAPASGAVFAPAASELKATGPVSTGGRDGSGESLQRKGAAEELRDAFWEGFASQLEAAERARAAEETVVDDEEAAEEASPAPTSAPQADADAGATGADSSSGSGKPRSILGRRSASATVSVSSSRAASGAGAGADSADKHVSFHSSCDSGGLQRAMPSRASLARAEARRRRKALSAWPYEPDSDTEDDFAAGNAAVASAVAATSSSDEDIPPAPPGPAPHTAEAIAAAAVEAAAEEEDADEYYEGCFGTDGASPARARSAARPRGQYSAAASATPAGKMPSDMAVSTPPRRRAAPAAAAAAAASTAAAPAASASASAAAAAAVDSAFDASGVLSPDTPDAAARAQHNPARGKGRGEAQLPQMPALEDEGDAPSAPAVAADFDDFDSFWDHLGKLTSPAGAGTAPAKAPAAAAAAVEGKAGLLPKAELRSAPERAPEPASKPASEPASEPAPERAPEHEPTEEEVATAAAAGLGIPPEEAMALHAAVMARARAAQAMLGWGFDDDDDDDDDGDEDGDEDEDEGSDVDGHDGRNAGSSSDGDDKGSSDDDSLPADERAPRTRFSLARGSSSGSKAGKKSKDGVELGGRYQSLSLSQAARIMSRESAVRDAKAMGLDEEDVDDDLEHDAAISAAMAAADRAAREARGEHEQEEDGDHQDEDEDEDEDEAEEQVAPKVSLFKKTRAAETRRAIAAGVAPPTTAKPAASIPVPVKDAGPLSSGVAERSRPVRASAKPIASSTVGATTISEGVAERSRPPRAAVATSEPLGAGVTERVRPRKP